jgi:hypothetical protein
VDDRRAHGPHDRRSHRSLRTAEPIGLELICHDGWLLRAEVREAMVMNPFTATPLVLALLPTVSVRRWRQLLATGDAHPLVAQAAEALLRSRGA